MAYTIENRTDSLIIRVPRFKRSARYYWIPLMLVAIYGVGAGLFRHENQSILAFCVLVILALLNCAVAYSEQHVIVRGNFISQAENYWGIVLVNRKMPLEGVSNLRYVAVRPWSFVPRPQGLALDWDGRERRVAAYLEKDEVEEIIAAIRNRFPALH